MKLLISRRIKLDREQFNFMNDILFTSIRVQHGAEQLKTYTRTQKKNRRNQWTRNQKTLQGTEEMHRRRR